MTSDRFITVTVEHQIDGTNPPTPVDVDMLVNLRFVRYFSFPVGKPAQMKMVEFSEMAIKNSKDDIIMKINRPDFKQFT